jgi:hypothetical protein
VYSYEWRQLMSMAQAICCTASKGKYLNSHSSSAADLGAGRRVLG